MLVLYRDHGASLHGFVPGQHTLDLPRLDPVASQFRLVVDTTHVFDGTVWQVARQVPGLVHPSASLARERVGDEPLGREARPMQVTPREARSSDVKFTANADGHRAQVGIQNVNPRVADWSADRDNVVGVFRQACP